MENHEIILKPVITEAVYDLIEVENKIVFEVHKAANKYMIKRAVEELYNVRVKKVNTLGIIPNAFRVITKQNEYKFVVKTGPRNSCKLIP